MRLVGQDETAPGHSRLFSDEPLRGMEASAAPGPRGSVLVVCRANVCRSPITGALLDRSLDGLGIHVSTAGLEALVDAPADPAMMRLADAELAWAMTGHRGTQLSGEHVRAADVILCATRRQRGEVVRRWPTALRRCFTLREFAVLVGLAADAGLSALDPSQAASSALRQRGRSRIDETTFDVVDPWGKRDGDYRHALELIDGATADIASGMSRMLLAGHEGAELPEQLRRLS